MSGQIGIKLKNVELKVTMLYSMLYKRMEVFYEILFYQSVIFFIKKAPPLKIPQRDPSYFAVIYHQNLHVRKMIHLFLKIPNGLVDTQKSRAFAHLTP